MRAQAGLVTPFDTGSHDDMDAATFMRSLFSLRGYFAAIAQAGAAQAGFARLQQLGIAAERAMSHATGGVNTHRGAIFNLGLLVAGAASLRAQAIDACRSFCGEVGSRWGASILASPVDRTSHGQRVARRHGAQGARVEAARGFPSLLDVAVPALRHALEATNDRNAAMVDTLMTLVASTEDTNLLHRGGTRRTRLRSPPGARIPARGRRSCIRMARAARCDRPAFQSLSLESRGSADLLACAWFLVRLERGSK